MARIRTIKPEFWSDEKLSPASDCTRLLFIALWSMADDYGRLLDNEKQIEAFVFPEEDRSRDVRESLARLSELGRIRRGTAPNGQRIIEIVHWERHQRVDKRSTRGALPRIAGAPTLENPLDSLARLSREFPETLAHVSRPEAEAETERDLGSGAETEAERASTPDLPQLEAGSSLAQLPAAPLLALREEFIRRFYANASAKRIADVEEQLGDVLTPRGARGVTAGTRVYATPATLAAALRECLAPGAVRNSDKAMAVLLRKLEHGRCNEVRAPGAEPQHVDPPVARRAGSLALIGDLLPGARSPTDGQKTSTTSNGITEEELEGWIASKPDLLAEREKRVESSISASPPQEQPFMRAAAQRWVTRELYERHGARSGMAEASVA